MNIDPSYIFNARQYWSIGKFGKIVKIIKDRSDIDYSEIENWVELTLPLYCLHSNGSIHFKNDSKICEAKYFEYISLNVGTTINL